MFPAAEKADRSREYINRSQTYERGNWDFGQAIPFLGIFVSNFRYWFFAMGTQRKLSFPFISRLRYLASMVVLLPWAWPPILDPSTDIVKDHVVS
jgi:hypothetical protein